MSQPQVYPYPGAPGSSCMDFKRSDSFYFRRSIWVAVKNTDGRVKRGKGPVRTEVRGF